MKAIKFFAIAILFSGVSVLSIAQDTKEVTANVEILAPITISDVVSMNFGKLLSVNNAYDVVLATTGAITSDNKAAIQLAGTTAAGSLKVNGAIDANFVLTLPSTEIDITGAGDAMKLTSFKSNLTDNKGKILSGGTPVTLGATLKVNAKQAEGKYTGTFNVTVAYE